MTVINTTQKQTPSAAEALSRTLAIGALAGALAGALVGGVLGRLAMRLLAATSPEANGAVTDDLFVVGRISMEGTLELAGFTTGLGLVAGVLYLSVRRDLPGSVRGRIAGFAVISGVVGGALIVRGHNSFDFSHLQPEWLATMLFVVLPAAGGAATAGLVEWAKRTRTWLVRMPTAALMGLALLVSFVGLALLFVLPMAAVAFAVTLVGPLRRLWERRWVTIAVRMLLVVLLAWGVFDLTRDVLSMAANRG